MVRRQKTGGKGKPWPESLLGLPQEGQGRAGQSEQPGVAGLSNPGRLWAMRWSLGAWYLALG